MEESKNEDASSSKEDTEEPIDENSARQRWKSTSGILQSAEDDDFGSKSRHSSTPGAGRTVAATSVSTPLVESLAAAAGSQCSGGGSGSAAEVATYNGD